MMTEIDFELLDKLIEAHELKSKRRFRKLVYKRAYIANELRSRNLTYQFIGDLLNKDHATIINSLMVFDNNCNYLDFVEFIGTLPDDLSYCFIPAFNSKEVKKIKLSSIEKRLLQTTKFGEFIRLKQDLINKIKLKQSK